MRTSSACEGDEVSTVSMSSDVSTEAPNARITPSSTSPDSTS